MSGCFPNPEKGMAEKPEKDYTPVSLDYDPIERGLTLTVDNSPRYRNYNVVKAKLREQEAIFALEKVELKNEFQKRETELQNEITSLRSYKDVLEVRLEEETKQKNELQLRQETTGKDMNALSSKCSELEGRLMESRAANETSKLCTEKLMNDHEAEIQTLRNEFATVESGYQEAVHNLEKTVADLENQLELTHQEYKKCISEQAILLKEKENEILELKENEKTRLDEIQKEKEIWEESVKNLKGQLQEMTANRDELVAELNQCHEEHKKLVKLMEEEHGVFVQKLEDEKEALTTQVEDLQEQLKTSKVLREEVECDLENCRKKTEESMKVLKDTLVVIDEQNKALTTEIETVRGEIIENDKFRMELIAKVDALLKQLNERQAEKEELDESKQKLEEQLSEAVNKLEKLTNDKGEEIRNLQNQIKTLQTIMRKEMEDKDSLVTDLRIRLEKTEASMSKIVSDKDDEIEELTKNLETLQSEHQTAVQEKEEINRALQNAKQELEEKTTDSASSKTQITKLNLEVSRLINTVVSLKEENIELKTGLNQSLQKAEFFKKRTDELTTEMAKLQCERTEKENELQTDIEEKCKIIEYFQAQSAAGSDKKKRRFFAGSPKKEKPNGGGSTSTL